MTRLVVVLSVALAVLVPGVARASVAVPDDLAALEQHTAALQANSERFSFQAELSLGSGVLGQGIPLDLLVAGIGESSATPPQAAFSSGLFGFASERVRVVGDTTYHYRPSVASTDKGRPWVRGRTTSTPANGLDPGGLLESDQSGRQGTFSKLIELLNGALAITESGPVTVDDQRVIEFDATLDPTPLLAKLESHSKQPGHPLGSLLEIPSVGGPNSKPKPSSPPPSFKLELFLAPSGLPVRARTTFSDEGATVSITVDTLAINVPVHVVAPPAGQTIDEATLKRLERRRAARELERALRACRRLHGKQAARCRALAHLQAGASAPSSEASLP